MQVGKKLAHIACCHFDRRFSTRYHWRIFLLFSMWLAMGPICSMYLCG
jgi:hypothetical protein